MPRKVWVTTTALPGADGPTVEANLAKASALLERACASRPDIVCLPEVFATRGVPYETAAEVAQPVPGAITDMAAGFARRYGAYIICPLLERRQDALYNSAVLLDRQGQVSGVYEKIHPVPGEDGRVLEKGLRSGQGPKTFDTDFGRIGILICFDINWREEWAALKRLGAEIVFWPSAYEGGLPLASRALDHHYYVVSSTTMLHSRIIDITGRTLAETGTYSDIAELEIDLEKRVLSTDWNLAQVPAIRARYGRDVTMNMLLDEDMMTLQSERPGLSVDQIVREFGLEYWSDYIARCTAAQAAERSS